MNRLLIGMLSIAFVALAGAACDDSSSNADSSATEPAATSGAESDLPQGDEPVDLDPATFTTEIDNEYWPMEPGTRWTYSEIDEEGNEMEVVVTVTSETKEIGNGVTARVVRDTVSADGEVIEDTFDWYAQDADGNIWYLGEDTAEFEGGEVSSTEGSWEAGVDGALAGVVVAASPVDDMQYRQEYFEGEAEDNGEVLSVDEQAEVPAGHYENCLLTKDTSGIETDVVEYKLYCLGAGVVLTLDISGGSGREELVSMETVDAEAAAAAGTTPLGETYP